MINHPSTSAKIWTPERILSLRRRLGLSQRQLAEKLEFTGKHRRETINRYEHGTREPSEKTAILLQQLEDSLKDSTSPIE